MILATVLLAAAGVGLGVPPPRRLPGSPPQVVPPSNGREGLARRWRWAWAACAGLGASVLVGGPLAVPVGVVATAVVGAVAGRIEPRAVRQRREEVRRDLPHLVTLLGAALRSGAAPATAITVVCRALPGAAAERLSPLAARLELGGDPQLIWGSLVDDPVLAPLGRTMLRSHRSGAPVVAAVERLSDDLGRRARAEVEDRARAVGVRAAVPLGICLLPAFLLIGIVPLVAGLAGTIAD